MFNRIFKSLTIIFAVTLLFSCERLDNLSRYDGPRGNLEVEVAFDLNRDPVQANSLANKLVSNVQIISSGIVNLEHDSEDYDFDLDIENGQASAKIENLIEGDWEVNVILYDQDDYPLMSGDTFVDIIAGETTRADVTVNYTSGILDLRIHLPAVQASMGYAHTTILSVDGTLFSAGWNQNDQLGYDTGSDNNSSVYKATLTGVIQTMNWHKTSVAIKSDGTVWGVGLNSYGELGLGNSDQQSSWIQSTGATNVIGGCADGSKVMLIKSDGSMIGAGHNNYGSFGDGTAENSYTNEKSWVDIDIDNVEDVACGDYHTLVLKKDGTLWATGKNTYGQLGIPSSNTTYESTYQYVTSNVKAISASNVYTLIIKDSGEVYGAGGNFYDHFNQGNTDAVDNGLAYVTSGAKKAIVSDTHNIYVIKDNYTLWTIGYDYSVYTQIASDVKDVYSNENLLMYITLSGDLYAAGNNLQGRLGTGNDTNIDISSPQLIFGD